MAGKPWCTRHSPKGNIDQPFKIVERDILKARPVGHSRVVEQEVEFINLSRDACRPSLNVDLVAAVDNSKVHLAVGSREQSLGGLESGLVDITEPQIHAALI